MATPKKALKNPSSKATGTKRRTGDKVIPSKGKVSVKKKASLTDAGDIVPITPVPCTCCPDCATAASGVLGSCEDGRCVDIGAPSFFGVLSFDPTRPTPLPYWEKPANFPGAELAALMAALVANMDAATKTALATALGI